MNKIPIYQVDAFTSELFKGNPAAVCPLENWLDESTMQNIGAENNLSETAFFVKDDGHFEITWFTPTSEIDLCGHATLASAHVLFNHLGYQKEKIVFRTKTRGEINVVRNNDLLTLDFPSTTAEDEVDPILLSEALGKKPVQLFKTRDYLAIFNSQEDIKNLSPDFSLLSQLDAIGIIVTAPGDNADFVSRFFAPAVGINEDPVTGSAHTTLIPYWSKRLNKKDLHAYQISSRTGELFCTNMGSRVHISGKAITYLEGFINIGD